MAESFNDFVAGWVSGAAGIIVGSPLDVLKARLQAPSTAATTTTTAETSPTAWQTLKRMVKYEGFGALFKGVLAPIMGLAGINAILFVSYGGILRAFERRHQLLSSSSGAFDNTNADFEPTLGQVYLAGCGAGIASFFFSTPTELVKIQAQVSRTPKSSWQVTREIFFRSGIRGFYQGGWITIIRDAPSYGIYFWVYEGMKRLLEVDQMQNTSGFNAWKLLLAGGAAGAVSWTSIYPIDVVKSRLQMQVVPSTTSPSTIVFSAPPEQTIFYTQKHHQQQRTFHNTAASSSSSSSTRLITATSNTNTGSSSALLETQPYTSIRDCIVRSYKAEGAGVFFRGVGPTILRAFPVNAVTFYVYEVMMEMLSK